MNCLPSKVHSTVQHTGLDTVASPQSAATQGHSLQQAQRPVAISPELASLPARAKVGATLAGLQAKDKGLSQGKRAFLAKASSSDDPANIGGRLSAENVEEISRIYEKKHNISIRVNGKGGGVADRSISAVSILDDLADTVFFAKRENKFIGYVANGRERDGVPNFRNSGDVHSEALIATSAGDLLNITPANFEGWFECVSMERASGRRVKYFSSSLNQLAGEIIGPQADMFRCGPLGLSYLKEYLKNDAENLKFSLLISSGTPDSEINFMLPCPQVLRYSQSSRYVDIIKHIVLSDDDLVVNKRNDEEVRVPTLRSFINSISAQVTTVDKTPFKEVDLKNYRDVWQNIFNNMVMPKRISMNLVDKSGVAKNLYLAQVAERMHGKIS
ncbi:hypothetical protein KDW41_30400 [Burkholderia vietnamiensis]|nr:hypothetical protein [Burkholderia vietnamiensis]